MTDLPAEDERLVEAFGDARGDYAAFACMPDEDGRKAADDAARAALLAHVRSLRERTQAAEAAIARQRASLAEARAEIARLTERAEKNYTDHKNSRAKYLRLKEHAKQIAQKSHEWKILYKAERGSYEDAIYKQRCRNDRLAEENASLRTQLDRLAINAGHYQTERNVALANLDATRALLREAREALVVYGIHVGDCPRNLSQPNCDWELHCTCGLDTAIFATGKKEQP